MSSLWTPQGERRVGGPPPAQPGPPPAQPGPPPAQPGPPPAPPQSAQTATDQELTEVDIEALRAQLAATPASAVIANHAFGLMELAALHLSQKPPKLDEARLAIDATGALLGELGGRLGDYEQALRDGLAQLRLAFVEVKGAPGSSPATPG